MRVFPVTWQRWRHIIRSAIADGMLYANFTVIYGTGVITDWSGIGNFILFAYVTLTLTRWPSYTNVTRISLRYPVDQTWSFTSRLYRHIQTDTQAKLLPRRFAGGNYESHKYSVDYSQTIYERECNVTASREAEEAACVSEWLLIPSDSSREQQFTCNSVVVVWLVCFAVASCSVIALFRH